jgi:dTDP-4-amino-4,6-dideoxygalactose transaminase
VDTFQALMFYHLPPVGGPVCLDAHGNVEPGSIAATLLSTDQARFYASGTAALAAAIIAAMQVKSIESAEVILPAYGCPDLISAAEFAGARPVLVDIEAGRPWLDLSQLASAITDNTVAIVAVNLFGISERWTQLRELAEKNDVVLIEDSAQYFPGGEEQQDWQGDLVVFSFGRGKPVSLLGGGAVLASTAALLKLLPQSKTDLTSFYQQLAFNLKAKLYNAMISPSLYWLPQSLPFLHLGETRYHALRAIEAMDHMRIDLLPASISCYQDDADAPVRCEKISMMLDQLTDLHGRLRNLPKNCNMEANRRLLRYPLLLEPASRDHTYQRLKQAGLGVSIMYPASLPEIPGMAHLLDKQQRFPNAEDFACRVLTLPTHKAVSGKTIEKMKTILSELE